MLAVDTNVLVYARDRRDGGKQATAIELIATLEPGALLWQVACEYLAATRKLEPLGFPREQAWADVQDFRRAWATILPA